MEVAYSHSLRKISKFADMSKSNWDISKQMQRDLIDAYKRVCGTCWSQTQAYERMVNEPAPRYYVSARQASQIISPMVRGDFERVNMMLPLRREMYYSLFEVVKQLFERREFIGKSLSFVMNFAVIQPAPKFFISAKRACMIRSYIRNGAYDDDGKVIDEKVPSYIKRREMSRKCSEEKKRWMLEKMSEGARAQQQ